MDITITINDDRLKEIVQSQIDGLSPDEIKDVVLKGLETYMTDHNKEVVESLFIKTRKSQWGYTESEESSFTRNLLEKLDYSKLQSIVDSMIDTLSKDYQRILVTCISEFLVKGMMNNYNLSAAIQAEVQRQIMDNSRRG